MKKRLGSMLLAAGLTLSLSACTGGKGGTAVDLMADVKAAPVQSVPMTGEQKAALTDFGLRLMGQAQQERENILLSPVSVAAALGMTANGAAGDTLTEMENAIGLKLDSLNGALHSYFASLPQSDGAALLPANSIWFADGRGLTVERDFLQTNANFYDAELYQLTFDKKACDRINSWIKEHTKDMIPSILDEIGPDAVMYLINALAFEGKWESPYYENQVSEGEFTTADGTKSKVDFLFGSEYQYLEREGCIGFLKPYEGGQYAFAALLPQDGMTPKELLSTLDGATLQALLSNPSEEKVDTVIPKFETDFFAELSDVLKAMGMERAFDVDRADFSKMGQCEQGPLLISRVLHRTFLSLTEEGTRAAAATVVEAAAGSAMPEQPPKEVRLDRPFVYMLVDTQNHIPFFIGILETI